MYYPNLTPRDRKTIVEPSTTLYEATILMTYGTHNKKYLYAIYTERGILTRPNIRQPKPSTAKAGCRNSGSCVHQSLCNIASIVYRRPHTDSWKRKLEKEHSPTEKRRLLTTSPDTLEEMANTHEILPHCRALVEALC